MTPAVVAAVDVVVTVLLPFWDAVVVSPLWFRLYGQQVPTNLKKPQKMTFKKDTKRILVSWGQRHYRFINSVFTGVFGRWCVACEGVGRPVYSQLCLHVISEYTLQQAISLTEPQNMLHAIQFTHSESHLYSCLRSQKLEILSVKRLKPSVNTRQLSAVYTSVANKNAGMQRVKTPVRNTLITNE